ncbi:MULTISPECIES: manganese efflux pump MntP family protein [unclassified Oleiphilus]|nr:MULTISPECIES: manganese efflux pump MntP family protein [unclassified Oleiphilus]
MALLLLAIALSMDAFAVSIGLGSKKTVGTLKLATMCAIYFGLFQGLMPLIGFIGGKGVLVFAETYAPWVSFILLLIIGIKMIYEALITGEENVPSHISHRAMFILGIATSIDAMAAGFSLTLLNVNGFLACAFIAITTALFSFAGVYLGEKTGTWLESRAEVLGGTILILIGLKVLLG